MALIAVNVLKQLCGIIKAIDIVGLKVRGDVVSEIEVETSAGIVTSVVTTSAITTPLIKELKLEIGSEVLALIKAIDVSIAKLIQFKFNIN